MTSTSCSHTCVTSPPLPPTSRLAYRSTSSVISSSWSLVLPEHTIVSFTLRKWPSQVQSKGLSVASSPAVKSGTRSFHDLSHSNTQKARTAGKPSWSSCFLASELLRQAHRHSAPIRRGTVSPCKPSATLRQGRSRRVRTAVLSRRRVHGNGGLSAIFIPLLRLPGVRWNDLIDLGVLWAPSNGRVQQNIHSLGADLLTA